MTVVADAPVGTDPRSVLGPFREWALHFWGEINRFILGY